MADATPAPVDGPPAPASDTPATPVVAAPIPEVSPPGHATAAGNVVGTPTQHVIDGGFGAAVIQH